MFPIVLIIPKQAAYDEKRATTLIKCTDTNYTIVPEDQGQECYCLKLTNNMYYIKKYTNCWAIHNDDNNQSRALTPAEAETVQNELPTLKEVSTLTVYADRISSIQNKP